MKKLTWFLTIVFVVAGTSAISMAANGSDNESISRADLSTANEEAETRTATIQTEEDKQADEENAAEDDSRISVDEAVATAMEVLDGKLDEVKMETEDGRLVYEVELEYEGEDYDFKIDVYNGEIIEIDDNLLNTPAADQAGISVQEIKQIINELFPDGKIDDIELEKKYGTYMYEVEVEYMGEDGDVYIDAETGDVLKIEDDLEKWLDHGKHSSDQRAGNKDTSTAENGRISPEQAKEIALDYVGKGYVDDIELENEKGMLLYEVEVEDGDDDIDVYIDAYTGEVVYTD